MGLEPKDLSVRQWVAYAGLDPKRHASGTSVEQRERISKVGNARIRRALYMPALVAVRCDRHIGALYEKLLARGKKPIVATVAVMRKLLHSIYGMLKHGQDFHGEKFYHIPENVPMAALREHLTGFTVLDGYSRVRNRKGLSIASTPAAFGAVGA
jgi:hypothetical protein